MPRVIPAALKAHLQQDCTTIAVIWTVTRRDGVVLRFTDADRDLIVSGETYAAATGYTASAIAARSDMSVDNLDVQGLIDSEAITTEDILAGLYSDAEVEIARVNFMNPADGKDILQVGNIGKITTDGTRFTAEIRGLGSRLQTQLGRVINPTCSAMFGDDKCKLNLSSFTFSASVTTATEPRRVLYSAALGQAENYFKAGVVTFTSGLNATIAREISAFKDGVFTVAEPFPFDAASGDAFTIVAGCNKKLATCKSFNNIVNFRGFPAVPGFDQITRNPKAEA